jgi:hypothetical protein
MNTQIDPFNVACMTLVAFGIIFIGFLTYSEVKEREIKANIVKEAIQKGWTPEQVKGILK